MTPEELLLSIAMPAFNEEACLQKTAGRINVSCAANLAPNYLDIGTISSCDTWQTRHLSLACGGTAYA